MKTIQAFVLAAGQGSRFNTGITKLIAPICGQPMVVYPVKTLQSCTIATTIIVGYQKERVIAALEAAHLPHLTFVEQTHQLGTGHALLCTQHLWHAESLLIMNGDMPFITQEVIEQLINEHHTTQAAISFIVAHHVDPTTGYGRLVKEHGITKIVEKKHFNGSISQHPYINAGIYLINRDFLQAHSTALVQNRETAEFYITDLVELASNHQLPVATVTAPYATIQGVNTFQELAQVEQVQREKLIAHWMQNGVRFMMPHTVHLDNTVTLGKGTLVHAGVQLFGSTSIGSGCTILPHTVLFDARIPDNTQVHNPGYSMPTSSTNTWLNQTY